MVEWFERFLEFLETKSKSYLYRIKKKIWLYLYEDDFKLCGAVQLLVGRRKKNLVGLVGGVNPLLPGKCSLVSSWVKNFCSSIAFVFFCFLLAFFLPSKMFLLCLLCLSHCKKKIKKKNSSLQVAYFIPKMKKLGSEEIFLMLLSLYFFTSEPEIFLAWHAVCVWDNCIGDWEHAVALQHNCLNQKIVLWNALFSFRSNAVMI